MVNAKLLLIAKKTIHTYYMDYMHITTKFYSWPKLIKYLVKLIVNVFKLLSDHENDSPFELYCLPHGRPLLLLGTFYFFKVVYAWHFE